MAKQEARVFRLETNFQKIAKRPGGLPRNRAIQNADQEVERIKPDFDRWLDEKLKELTAVIAAARGDLSSDWIETVRTHSLQLRDVGSTTGSELLTFIADSLCDILTSLESGGECVFESVDCHLDALRLVSRKSYRGLKPHQVPELTRGLRRVAQRVSAAQSSSPK
jgi:hypothetical protein